MPRETASMPLVSHIGHSSAAQSASNMAFHLIALIVEALVKLTNGRSSDFAAQSQRAMRQTNI